jgi:hypothetical protein
LPWPGHWFTAWSTSTIALGSRGRSGLPVLPHQVVYWPPHHKVMVKGQAEVLHIRALLDDHCLNATFTPVACSPHEGSALSQSPTRSDCNRKMPQLGRIGRATQGGLGNFGFLPAKSQATRSGTSARQATSSSIQDRFLGNRPRRSTDTLSPSEALGGGPCWCCCLWRGWS